MGRGFSKGSNLANTKVDFVRATTPFWPLNFLAGSTTISTLLGFFGIRGLVKSLNNDKSPPLKLYIF
jgi:hypothetical protein